jgi:hypothetical protein
MAAGRVPVGSVTGPAGTARSRIRFGLTLRAVPLAIAAAQALVDAYAHGAEAGGSVDWADIDAAHRLAAEAVRVDGRSSALASVQVVNAVLQGPRGCQFHPTGSTAEGVLAAMMLFPKARAICRDLVAAYAGGESSGSVDWSALDAIHDDAQTLLGPVPSAA